MNGETMKTKICLQCGKEFETHYGQRKYCSRECAKEVKMAWMKEHYEAVHGPKPTIMKCIRCGKETPFAPNKLYCRECGIDANRENQRRNRAEKQKRKQTAKQPGGKRPSKKKKVLSLAEINSIARSRGKSYGQQVAEMFMQANVCK